MKNYIVIFREPDGRTVEHTADEISQHQANWKSWFDKWGKEGRLNGGSGLTLNGRILKGDGNDIIDGIHKNGTEIIGGFLLLKVEDLDEATTIMKACPIFEFGGYAEIREMQN